MAFGIAYNAALKLCTNLIYVSGDRPEKSLPHYRTLQALPLILGAKRRAAADYLDACRNRRNTVEYDYAGGATKKDADELIEFTRELRADVRAWWLGCRKSTSNCCCRTTTNEPPAIRSTLARFISKKHAAG